MTDDEPTRGLPLDQAIRQFADQEKWRAYQEAAAAAAGKRRKGYFSLGDEPIAGWGAYDQARADNALLRRKECAWKEVLQDFVARLQSGELLATGLFAPLGAGSERRVIQPELWSVLTPHFGRSSAVLPHF